MTVQFIEVAGHRMAILPAADYDRLIDAAEDRADANAAERARRRRDAGEEYLPASMLDRLLQGENGLKVWREYRQMSGPELAARASTTSPMIYRLESGQRQGSPAMWRRLASALGVELTDIMPAE